MATLSVKPGQRFTLPDWHTNCNLISSNAERQRSASHQIRQEARTLRNETNNQVGGFMLALFGMCSACSRANLRAMQSVPLEGALHPRTSAGSQSCW